MENKIISYFIIYLRPNPRIIKTPFNTSLETIKQILKEKYKYKGIDNQRLLKVFFDTGSQRIHIENHYDFNREEIEFMLVPFRLLIQQQLKIHTEYPEVYSSPFKTLRVRSIDSFPYTLSSLKKDQKNLDLIMSSLPIIEADLDKMPITTRKIELYFPEIRNIVGCLITQKEISSLNFIESIDSRGEKREIPLKIFEQKSPFILINLSSRTINYAEKERTVLEYVYKFIQTNNKNMGIIEKFNFSIQSMIQQIIQRLYLGWPFEEICYNYMERSVNNFNSFVSISRILIRSANIMESYGYKSPISSNYYMSFKINPETFPISLESISTNGKIDPAKQSEMFKVIKFDEQTNDIFIETPLIIPQNICKSIFRAISEPIIAKYNPILNVTEIKTRDNIKEDKEKTLRYAEMRLLIGPIIEKTHSEINYRTTNTINDERSVAKGYYDPNLFILKNISEYYGVTDRLKDICNKNGVEFTDIKVLVAPLETIFGRGTAGGFMCENEWKLNKWPLPYEISPGIFIKPPIIFIDSIKKYNYAAQLDVLVHEYSHNLFTIAHPEHVPEYLHHPELKQTNEKRWWSMYLTDPDERGAFRNQIKILLSSGKTEDEIIMEIFSSGLGFVPKDFYTSALKLKEIIDEAKEEMEGEEALANPNQDNQEIKQTQSNSNNFYKTSQSNYVQELIKKFDIQDPIEILWIIKLEKYLKEFQFNNEYELNKEINKLIDINKTLIQQTKEQANKNLFPFYVMEVVVTTKDPEILKKVLSRGKDDEVSRSAAENKNCPPEALAEVLSRGKDDEVSISAAWNKNCPPEALAEVLSRGKNDEVSKYALKNPNFPPEALAEVLSRGKDDWVSQYAVKNTNCPPEALAEVLSIGKDDWVSRYAAQNSNCPPEALAEVLSRGKNDRVSWYAAQNPNCPPEALAEVLSRGKDDYVSRCAAKNLNCPKDIKEWWEKNKK